MIKQIQKHIFLLIFGLLVSSELMAKAVSSNAANSSYLILGSSGSSAAGQGIQADKFSGAATYQIKIPVPPGRGGLQPNLVFNYNSHRKNANSWVGYGWELELGSIERVPESDGRIDYESGTKFALKIGGQSLTIVRTAQGESPDDYGITGFSGYFADIYQANVETDFSIYVHIYGSNFDGMIDDQGWFVKDKSGTTYQFGTDLERYSLVISEVENDEGEIIQWISKWQLTSVTDANDNAILVSYTSSFQPYTIEYSEIEIRLVYSNRIYFPLYKQYQLSKQQANNRLSRIDVKDGSNTLMSYDLEYTTSVQANHSLLTSITQTDANGQSLPSTTFDYYDLDPSSFGWSTTANEFSGSRTDCDNPTSSGYLGDYSVITDMNGDALPDLVLSCRSNDTIRVLFNNGNDFEDRGSVSNWTDPLHDQSCDSFAQGTLYELCGKLNAGYANSDGPNQTLYLIDMNGDSLPDRVMATSSTSGNGDQADFLIAFNTGSGFDSNLKRWRDPYIGSGSGNSDSQRSLIDMNGDGLVDRVVGNNSYEGFYVYFNNGAGFDPEPVHWTDAISLYGDTNGHADIYSPYTGDTKSYYLRDFNGDGYTDRFRRVDTCYENDVDMGPCLAVEINREGHEWALPDYNPDNNRTICDGIDNLCLFDPVTDSGNIAKVGPKIDWIDFNNDGLVDRIEGDTESGTFNVYLYGGMSSNEWFVRFDSVLTLDDPISDVNRRGVITSSDSMDTEGARTYAFLADMNGDGYPDRVYGDGNKFYVYTLQVNPLEFSDTATDADDPNINQPNLALKSIDDGRGGRMVIEYLPTTAKRDDGNHRFLPFPLYTIHKMFLTDHSVASGDGTVESDRNPGMRYSTYDFYGGNYYIRHAQKATSDPDDPTLTTTHYSTFNGFQQLDITTSPMGGETWGEQTVSSYFHQSKGDAPADDSLFDANGYGDLSLSGRPYKTETIVDGTTRVTQDIVWSATDIDTDNGIDWVTKDSKTKTIFEDGGATERVTVTTYDYDNYGNVTQETLADDNGTILLVRISTYYDYDEGGLDTSLMIRNRLASQSLEKSGSIYRATTYQYDANGNVTQEDYQIDASGTQFQTVTKSHNSYGNLETLTGTDGVTRSFTYDANNIFPVTEQVTLPSGGTLTIARTYDRMSGQLTSEINDAGIGTVLEYDGFGRPLKEGVQDTSGSVQYTKYYDYEFITATVDGWPNTRLLKVQIWEPQIGHSDTQYPGGNPSKIVYSNASGQVLQGCSYSERGNYRQVQTRISENGRIITTTEPSFDSDCNFISALSGGSVHVNETDALNRPIIINPPDGDADSPIGETTIGYSADGNGYLIKMSTTSTGLTTREVYDHQGRLIEITDPKNETLVYTYNPVGDLKTITHNGSELTTVGYDLLGRKTESWDGNLGTWTYEYNSTGQLEQQNDNMGQYIGFDYDSIGRITRKNIFDASGTLESYSVYSYDSGDGTHSVLPGELFKVEEFDGSGTDLRTARYGYDSLYRYSSIITRTIDAVDYEQTITKDFRGLTQSITYPGGETVYQNYDRAGKLQQMCSIASCDASSGEIYYSVEASTGYNEYGGILKVTYGNGVESSYDYFTASHRLQGLTVAKGSEKYSYRNYTYDTYSNITNLSDPLGSTSSEALSSVAYDDLNRLTSYTSSTTATNHTFTYNTQGNLLTNSRNYGTDVYEYNSTKPHAVTQIGSETFTYDDNGNMTADGDRSMTYNAQNQLTQVTMTNGAIISFEYDYTGNRVKKTAQSTNPDMTVENHTSIYLGSAIEIRDERIILYLHANNQKIVTKALGTVDELLSSTGASLKHIGIDPGIRLATLTPYFLFLILIFIIASFRPIALPPSFVRRGSRGGRKTTRLLIRILHIWCAYTRAMQEALFALPHCFTIKLISLTLVFIITTQIPMQAMADTEAPSISDEIYMYYHSGDHLGSSHLITEGNPDGGKHSGLTYSRGDLIQRYEYAPFGKETYVLNPNLDLTASYTGQNYDSSSGLYYYKSRYYNPKLARFIQPDTVIPDATHLQSYNRYSYVVNNPLKYVDPTGHFFGYAGGGINISIGAIFNAPGSLPTVQQNLANSSDFHFEMDNEYNAGLVSSVVSTPQDALAFFDEDWKIFSDINNEKEYSLSKLSFFDSLSFNPAKLASSLINSAYGAFNLVRGAAKILVAAGLIETGIGTVGSVPLFIMGAINMTLGNLRIQRGQLLFNEAMAEDGWNATTKNFLGILPLGQHYDDPWEPGPLEYFKSTATQNFNNISEIILEGLGAL